ncbi:MAG: GNAT family N-acetyltransferase [Chloroflexi bacterium]|nr:MAG: GNAT family N-acetyltransferase [Chloroflexota bacterium]
MPWLYAPQRFFINGGVLEQHRGRGIGQTLYDHLLRCIREEYDGNEIHTWTTENRPFSIRFLEKRGFVEKMRNWESRLDTTNFDFSRYEGIEDKAAASGVQIKSLAELLEEDPDALRKLYDLEWVLVQDVPTTRESTKVPFEEWVERYGEKNKGYMPEGNFIAIAPDGEYIGISALWRSQSNDMLYTGLTGVKREWRRKSIARAMKIRAIRLAKDMGNRTICTWNEQNNPMYLLNVELGFIAQPAEILYINELE